MFQHWIPDAESALALQPEQLAEFVLAMVQQRGVAEVHFQEIFHSNAFGVYEDVYRPRLRQAAREAWSVLVREGLLIEDEEGRGRFGLSRRGRAVAQAGALEKFRFAQTFPKRSLHPKILEASHQIFLTGKFDAAVFEAFKTVEIEVRDRSGLVGLVGEALMRRAFDSSTGPLTDHNEEASERIALSHLFAGATGRFRNPTGHRKVNFDDPIEAIEMIQFASQLMRILESRGAAAAPAAAPPAGP